MAPICFEEGILHGPGAGAAEFMTIAAETFMKEFLGRLFASTRSNGPRWIKTGKYKRRLRQDEEGFAVGDVRKSTAGLLPVEQEAESLRPPLSILDLRLSLNVGGNMIGKHTPYSLAQFEAAGLDEEVTLLESEETLPVTKQIGPSKLNGSAPLPNGVLTNGVHEKDDDAMDIDSGWVGSLASDRAELDAALDDILERMSY